MTNVEHETGVLVREIKRSNEYNQYQRLRRKLSADGDLMKRLDEYRRRCFYLQNKEPEDDDELKLQELEKENEDILSMPPVSEFLLSEQKLCRMIRKIMMSVTQAAGLELEL